MEYKPNDIIAGKYRLTVPLGEGGMGTVWLARNMTLHSDVAIKLVRREIAGSEEAAQRLLNEARAAAQLRHPSIVQVHDFGETIKQDPFIVMEVLKGDSFEDRIKTHGRLDPAYAVQVLLPVLSALAQAHSRGIIHRDIKPDNIFMVPDEEGEVTPKLVDFGIAKLHMKTVERDEDSADLQTEEGARDLAKRLTRMGDVVGCPEYMCPEQASAADDIDERVDLWSLSVVLYEAICGQLPFDNSDPEELIIRILIHEPPPIAECGVDDPELWQIIRRGLSKDRDERWPTARDMGKALARWLVDRGIDSDVTGRALTKQWLKELKPALGAAIPDARASLPSHPGMATPFSRQSQPSHPGLLEQSHSSLPAVPTPMAGTAVAEPSKRAPVAAFAIAGMLAVAAIVAIVAFNPGAIPQGTAASGHATATASAPTQAATHQPLAGPPAQPAAVSASAAAAPPSATASAEASATAVPPVAPAAAPSAAVWPGRTSVPTRPPPPKLKPPKF